MGFVIKHRRRNIHCLADQILTDDDNSKSRRAHVFLSTGINHGEFGNIDRFRKNAGTHIRHKRNIAGFRQFSKASAVNGIVPANMEVVCVLVKSRRVELRNIRKCFVRAGRYNISGTVTRSFLICFFCPLTGYNKIRLIGTVHQIKRNHGKLCRSTALQKQNLVIIRNIHHFAQQRLAAFDDIVIFLRTVGHFHNGLSASLIIKHFPCSFCQNGFRQHGRSRAEIKYSTH